MKKIKFKKDLKINFKKNEIVIYAIALMLVTAGYYNYSTSINKNLMQTSSNEINNDIKEANIGDARLVNSNNILEEENYDEQVHKTEEKETKETEINPIDTAISTKEENIEQNENTEEAEETSIPAETNSNYFANSRLERETRFASMISTYTKILEDDSISETQKSIAMKEITKINESKNAVSICENLLGTKGFQNSLVLVNNDSINVLVEKKGKLTDAEVAQIQNIISREFNVDIEKIHISEKE